MPETLFLEGCKRSKSQGLYCIFFFVFDCSSLPPRLFDLLTISRPLWPLPRPHKVAAERTVCAQLWPRVLPGWRSLCRYGSRQIVRSGLRPTVVKEGVVNAGNAHFQKPFIGSKAIHGLWGISTCRSLSSHTLQVLLCLLGDSCWEARCLWGSHGWLFQFWRLSRMVISGYLMSFIKIRSKSKIEL